ncbi:MAG: restriction endonuclease, partial [Thiomargarita sp.]|nr:restriction endonuclease [Thiomargarita sp.]
MSMMDWMKELWTKTEPVIKFRVDCQELVLFTDCAHFTKLEQGQGGELALAQFVHLKMLVEQGLAEPISNGFVITSENAVRLESDLRFLFGLPSPWSGSMELMTESNTSSTSFCLFWKLRRADGSQTGGFNMDGPLLRIGEQETYLPTTYQWHALDAVAKHQSLKDEERNEYNNLLTIHHIQQAITAGLDADLRHFDNIRTIIPKHVTVAVTVENSGDLRLEPSLGGELATDVVATRLGQIMPKGSNVQSLRVKDSIILLDSKKLSQIREIIQHRRIPKSKAKQFFKTPSSILNPALVDMEEGFSVRVKGKIEFRQAYFGETAASDINWLPTEIEVKGAKDLDKIIKDLDDLECFRVILKNTEQTGAKEIEFNKQVVDVDNRIAIEQSLNTLEKKLRLPKESKTLNNEPKSEKITETSQMIVIDTALNDDELEIGNNAVSEQDFYTKTLDWSLYQRQPFPHQKQGIRWLLGLAEKTIGIDSDKSHSGALLADDMGLGKTFMSLASIQEFYKLCNQQKKPCKPVLIVAPLSLLEVWRQEISDSFKETSFEDIIILHGDADLKRFRIEGEGIETSNQDMIGDGQARLSLKVGSDPNFGSERLDRPKRLVLTNYNTLSNYQFSLCRVDWSFVIFDEAQNIKNPNTLQTRAAKAIKAQFRLMVTSTPVENSLTDYWCIMDTAKPGLLDSYQEFRKQYILPILRADSDVQHIREEVGKVLREKVKKLMLRRMKEDHLEGLPSKTIYTGVNESNKRYQYLKTLACTMTKHQLKVYNSVVKTTVDEMHEKEDGKENPILIGLMRLREVSLHPDLLMRSQLPLLDSVQACRNEYLRSGKLAAVLTILDEIYERDEKVLIFVINKRLQVFLVHSLEHLFDITVPIINGDTKAIAKNKTTRTRQRIIADFQKANGFGIIVMSPIAAGVGLTITAANNVIHLERHWNPAKEDQATDRVYRIGQKRNVNVYIPILLHPSYNSFDLNLHHLLSRKIDLKDAVVTIQDIPFNEIANSSMFDCVQTNPPSTVRLQPEDLRRISWKIFEALVAELLVCEYGGDAYLTKHNDKGCDVVLISPKKNMLVQCKATSQMALRGDSFVREIQGAQTWYENKMATQFTFLTVITNAHSYSNEAKKIAKMYSVELFDYNWLKKRLQQHSIEL